jgi:hypothetical protein
MKTKKNIFFIAMTVLFTFISCSKDDNKNDSPNPSGGNLGTYVGFFQVSDDPQTDLGYIYNSKVTVSTSGTNVAIKVIGNEGFDREYTGSILSTSGTITNILLSKQTKPVDKIIAGTCGIINNSLVMDVSYASDNITVKKTPTSTSTISITGKVRMIGTDFIKQ